MRKSFFLQDRRSGSVLVFLLAAMSIAAVVLSTMVAAGSSEASVAANRELDAVAEALALSGIELMVGIESRTGGPDNGEDFMRDRERDLVPGTAYEWPRLFGLPADATSRDFTGPVPYPPLDDLALEEAPRNDPPAIQDNDIRLPLYDVTRFLANTTTPVPGTSPAAILPASNCRPRNTDSEYSGPGVVTNPPYRTIRALEPPAAAGNPAIAWWGPKNTASMLPADATYQGGSASRKMPPPSLLFVRDVGAGSGTVRGFIFCWYVKSRVPAFPLDHILVSSARLRRVYRSGITEELGPEEMVSRTQVR